MSNWYVKPKSKYGAEKTEMDGHVFASKNEAQRYAFLKMMERAGEIKDLRLQVSYELIPPIYGTKITHLKTKDKTETICLQRAINYVSDFVYTVTATNEEIVEDFKGFKTPVFDIKQKLFFWKYRKNIYCSKRINEPITTKTYEYKDPKETNSEI